MGVRKKGRRKICVDNKKYVWYVERVVKNAFALWYMYRIFSVKFYLK